MSTQEPTTAGGGTGGRSGGAVPAKGLRAGILDLGDSVMLGLASTAPVYSLAATLGLIVAVNGNYTPLILLLGFIPVLFIAYAFRELNSAMPDCGTTFIWARRAFGPWAGWLGGWGVALAGIVVLANLAQVAGQYLWLLIGDGSLAENKLVVTATGVLFIVFMTLVNYRGHPAGRACPAGPDLRAVRLAGHLRRGDHFQDRGRRRPKARPSTSSGSTRPAPSPIPARWCTASCWPCSSTGAGTPAWR